MKVKKDTISYCLDFFNLYGKWYTDILEFENFDPEDYFNVKPSKMGLNDRLVYMASR